jgi:hypothetical protein
VEVRFPDGTTDLFSAAPLSEEGTAGPFAETTEVVLPSDLSLHPRGPPRPLDGQLLLLASEGPALYLALRRRVVAR